MRRRRFAAVAAVAASAAACLPDPATSEARAIADLYALFMGVAAVVAVIVLGLTVFAIVRYRRRSDADPDEIPEQIHGNVWFEFVWTALPILTIIVLFAFTFAVIERVKRDEAATGTAAGAVEIGVVAFRWGWIFEYPGTDITIAGWGEPGPEVVVPVGEPVRLILAAEDVIHSFYVPEFLFKRDMIPGRDNIVAFTVEEAGVYRGQCAEFCGVFHARMPFTVRAVDRAAFDAWLEEQAAEAAGGGAEAGPGGAGAWRATP